MTQYFTDFTSYTADAQPSDWTERWGAANAASNVRTIGIPTGGGSAALEMVASADSRYAVSWDEVGTPSGDVEVLAKVHFENASGLDSVCRVFLHGSGSAGTENSYFTESRLNTNFLDMSKYVSGTATTSASTSKTLYANTWYWVRLQRTGTTIRGRIWTDGDAEPGTWDVSATDAALSSGWVGAGLYYTTGSHWVDQIGVGTGGDAAPDTFNTAASGTIATTSGASGSATGINPAAGTVTCVSGAGVRFYVLHAISLIRGSGVKKTVLDAANKVTVLVEGTVIAESATYDPAGEPLAYSQSPREAMVKLKAGTTATAASVASTHLAFRQQPREYLTGLKVPIEYGLGIQRGRLLRVSHGSSGVDGSYVVRRVTHDFNAAETTVEVGDYDWAPRDDKDLLARLAQRIQQMNKESG